MLFVILPRGVCRISQGGGPTLKFLEYCKKIMKICSKTYQIAPFKIREQRSCESSLGGFGGMPPNKIFKNGAISCVLEAIFKQFHGKKSSKKIINKHEFFH